MKNLSDHPDYPKILDEERDKLDKELATTTEGKDLLDEGEDWGGLPSDPIPHPTPEWEKEFDKRFLATNYDDVIGIDNPASIIKSFIRQAISEAVEKEREENRKQAIIFFQGLKKEAEVAKEPVFLHEMVEAIDSFTNPQPHA